MSELSEQEFESANVGTKIASELGKAESIEIGLWFEDGSSAKVWSANAYYIELSMCSISLQHELGVDGIVPETFDSNNIATQQRAKEKLMLEMGAQRL